MTKKIVRRHYLGFQTYWWITVESAQWNVVNIAKRSIPVKEGKHPTQNINTTVE